MTEVELGSFEALPTKVELGSSKAPQTEVELGSSEVELPLSKSQLSEVELGSSEVELPSSKSQLSEVELDSSKVEVESTKTELDSSQKEGIDKNLTFRPDPEGEYKPQCSDISNDNRDETPNADQTVDEDRSNEQTHDETEKHEDRQTVNESLHLRLEIDDDQNEGETETEEVKKKDPILDLCDAALSVHHSRKREKVTNIEEGREQSSKKRAKKDLDSELKVKVQEYRRLKSNLKSFSNLVDQCSIAENIVKNNLLKCGVRSHVLEDANIDVESDQEPVDVRTADEVPASQSGTVTPEIRRSLLEKFNSPPPVSRNTNIFTNMGYKDGQSLSVEKDDDTSSMGKVGDDVEVSKDSSVTKTTEHSSSTKGIDEKNVMDKSPIVINPIKKESESDDSDDVIFVKTEVGVTKKQINVDVTKVKKEKGTTGIVMDRKTLKSLITRDKQGKILCPLLCNSSFMTANAMYIHVETQVCQKTVNKRNMITCRFENCTHETVTKSAMRNHEMTHLGLKDYVCPVPNCGQSFGHGSSLVNHKYSLHFDIFPPPKS